MIRHIFTALLELIPSCENTFNTTKGTIFSPNYPLAFPATGRDCTWEIRAKENELIRLEILSFKVDQCGKKSNYEDYVKIYDGSSVEADELWHLCGSYSKDYLEEKLGVSSKNSLFVRFHSWKRGRTTRGFEIKTRLFKGNMHWLVAINILYNLLLYLLSDI